eukprot:6181060-Pleurochrysis_carterae.AAC.3
MCLAIGRSSRCRRPSPRRTACAPRSDSRRSRAPPRPLTTAQTCATYRQSKHASTAILRARY